MNMKQQQSVQWYDLGPLSDVPLRGARRVVINKQPIGLFRTASNEVYAIEDRCPHHNGPLSDGIVHDNCVTCPLHNWVISLRDGTAQGADNGNVAVYPVQIVDGSLTIGVSACTTPELFNATD